MGVGVVGTSVGFGFPRTATVTVGAAAASDSDVVSDNSCRDGDWGEKDGKEVRDLSDVAMEEAELEGCEINFLGLDFALVEWLRLPEAEAAESCDVDRSRGADDSGSMLSLS